MNDQSHTHREVVAAVASLKSCLRAVLLAVSPSTPSANPPSASVSKIDGSVQRASDAVSKLEALLSAVANQTLRLPLETSKRLVDVGLPDLLQQLLSACQVTAAWPAVPAESSGDGSAGDAAADAGGAAANAADLVTAVPATVPAALHPSWTAVQQLLQAVFNTLAVLTSVLIRACTRCHEPAMVLMQLASRTVMEAQVAYMQQLKQHIAAPQPADAAGPASTAEAASVASESRHCAAACVAAFTSIYGLLAAATDAQAGLGELRQQLLSSLCSSNLLPAASELLLLVPFAVLPEEQEAHDVQADCQAAAWSLLTLALFLSGASISVSPASFNPSCIQPGQPLPSSMMAASIRADSAEPQQQQQPLDLAAAFASAAEPSAATLQQQLLSAPVLALLQERLYHCVTELRGSYGASSTVLAQQQQLLRQAGFMQVLPGRCCPADQDVLHAALRALRCWRALLMGPAAGSLPLVSGFGVQLMLTLLSGVLAEPIKAGSSEREALRGRVIRVAVHCLQLLCSCLGQDLLFEQLPALTAALSGVVATAGAYWDTNKRAVKSESLPYTGQVRCVDKTTGDMMVRYTMAAQSALDLLRQLLATCKAYAAVPVGNMEAGGARVSSLMLSAGVLPAVEQLFRQLPVVSPAHVTAAAFLVELLPPCPHADLSAGQLPLLATLRKFTVKSVGIPEPDGEAALITVTHFAALLGALADATAARGSTGTVDPAGILLQHASVQLLPALQAYVSSALKVPIPAPYGTTISDCSVAATAAALSSSGAADAARTHLLPVMLTMLQQLAAAGCAAPHLQLRPVLLSSQVLQTVSDILSTNYWLLPGFLAAAASRDGRLSPAMLATLDGCTSRSSSASGASSASMFSGAYAAQMAVKTLEALLGTGAACAAADAAVAGAANGNGMHASCSADCLCALKRGDASNEGAACQIGNPKCGLDGWCCCGSPKACSDITPPVTPQTISDARQVVPPAASLLTAKFSGQHAPLPAQQQQQQLLVLSALLQSRVLPECLRLLQQLPGGPGMEAAATSKGNSPRPGDSSAGVMLGSSSRPGSATGLSINVPPRRGSFQRDFKAGGVSPHGPSPKGFSPLGHSAPTAAVPLANSLRSQPTSTQSFLSAYMGDLPGTALGVGSSSSSAGQRVTAAGTSRFASTGSAASGTSPRYADDGAFGLLRAGSGDNSINWTAGTSLLQEAGVKVAARDNSGLGSSPSLASLASPHAYDNSSPFVMEQQPATAGGPGGSSSSSGRLQQQVQALLLSVAQGTLVLADAGLLGPELKQRRLSGTSAPGDSDSGGAGTPVAAVLGGSLPRPALSHGGSGVQYSLLSAGVSRQLSGAGSVGGGSGSYSSYLQSMSGPRTSLSGSSHHGGVSAEEVVAGIRSCLAAAGAAAALAPAPGSGVAACGAAGAPAAAAPQPGAAQVAGSSTAASPVADGLLSTEPSNSDVIFPVELGLSQLTINTPATADNTGAAAPAPAAPPCTPATPAVLGPVPATRAAPAANTQQQAAPALSLDVLRRLQGALTAAAPLLARYSGPLASEVLCPQLMLAQLAPGPVGCWNACCTNMPGVSEAGVPSKPCGSCKIASFCSKGCEKKAWAEHTQACRRLAALTASTAGSTSV